MVPCHKSRERHGREPCRRFRVRSSMCLWLLRLRKGGCTNTWPVCSCSAQLALPSTLSSEERKRWHQVARQAGLYSSSSGLRENRRLLVHASAVDSTEQWKKRDIKVQTMARENHELLCEAHGGHSTYSLSELEEMIVTGVEMPPAILTLKTIKCVPCS